jgi:AraC family transcriptional regulator
MREITQSDHIERISRVIAQIRSEPERTLSLTDIADIVALSPFHAIRVFRLITGYTPAAMQTALRIQQAKRLLAVDRMSVTDTCFTVGFSSLGSFSQRFSSLTAVNPSEYRTARDRADDLAEELYRIERIPRGPAPEPHSVSGRLVGQESPPCFYFVGLFPPGPPQGRPIRGDVLNGPGEFVIRHVPDGTYVIYSAAIATPRHAVEWVMPDTELLTGGGQTVQMCCGMPVDSVEIKLRARSVLVTPLLTTLMAIPNLAADARLNHRVRH